MFFFFLDRNWHNIVKQQYFDKNQFQKKSQFQMEKNVTQLQQKSKKMDWGISIARIFFLYNYIILGMGIGI